MSCCCGKRKRVADCYGSDEENILHVKTDDVSTLCICIYTHICYTCIHICTYIFVINIYITQYL